MKIAVIGAGRVGQVHAEVLAKRMHELVVYDVDPRLSHDLAQKVGGAVASSALEAFASVDAAVIATPPATHAAMVRAATDLDRPVLCEKPLAPSAASAEQLAKYVAERGALVQIGFQRRFDPEYAALRDAIHRGDVGELHFLRFTSTETGLAPSPKTNIFRNTAIHDFDLVRWLSGDEVASIFVQGSVRTGGDCDLHQDPDTIVAAMRLGRGALATATVSRLSPDGYDARAEVLGSRAHVSTGMGPNSPVGSVDNITERRDRGVKWTSWRTRFAEAFDRQLCAFLRAVEGQSRCGATPDDAVRAQQLAEAARRSMELNAPVRLDGAE